MAQNQKKIFPRGCLWHIHKISICKKEAKETKHWLRMISTACPEIKTKCRELWKECQELTLIFSSIVLPKKKKEK